MSRGPADKERQAAGRRKEKEKEPADAPEVSNPRRQCPLTIDLSAGGREGGQRPGEGAFVG